MPKSREQILAFKSMGIGLVVSVIEKEFAPAPALFRDTAVQHLVLDVDDYKHPTKEQMYEFYKTLVPVLTVGDAVLVHCRAGIGRTATVLASFALKYGLDESAILNQDLSSKDGCAMSASDAIIAVQGIRPCTNLTHCQKGFVAEMANELWREVSVEDGASVTESRKSEEMVLSKERLKVWSDYR